MRRSSRLTETGFAGNVRFTATGWGLPCTDLPYVTTSPLNWPPLLHQLGLGGPQDSAHTLFLFSTLGARLLEDCIAQWNCAGAPEFGIRFPENRDAPKFAIFGIASGGLRH